MYSAPENVDVKCEIQAVFVNYIPVRQRTTDFFWDIIERLPAGRAKSFCLIPSPYAAMSRSGVSLKQASTAYESALP